MPGEEASSGSKALRAKKQPEFPIIITRCQREAKVLALLDRYLGPVRTH